MIHHWTAAAAPRKGRASVRVAVLHLHPSPPPPRPRCCALRRYDRLPRSVGRLVKQVQAILRTPLLSIDRRQKNASLMTLKINIRFSCVQSKMRLINQNCISNTRKFICLVFVYYSIFSSWKLLHSNLKAQATHLSRSLWPKTHVKDKSVS